ncbi:hypothetical protein KY312_01520 [Candidatus Woesearchaeota archaeon]|nr:hypothetical protein [Candidatus Woesearchaeota archaeon]
MNKKIIKLLKNNKEPVAIVSNIHFNGILFSRALHKEGVKVIGVIDLSEIPKNDPLTKTNSCKKLIVKNSTNFSFIKLLVELGEIAKTKPVLIPTGDFQVLLFSKHRKLLEKYFLFNLPSEKAIQILMDKTKFYEWGNEIFLFPKTIQIKSEKDIEKIKKINFPVALKPKYRNAKWNKKFNSKTILVNSKEELFQNYKKVKTVGNRFLISEWIGGPVSNLKICNVYYSKAGNLALTQTLKKIRLYPLRDGSGCLIVTDNDEKIKKICKHILNKLNYKGIGGIEFRYNPADNKPYIIEPFAGRPSSPFCLFSGQNINAPYLIYCDIIGKKPPKFQYSNKEAKYIWETSDFMAAFNLISKRKLSLWSYVKSLKGINVYVYFSIRDPLPGLYLIKLILKKALFGRINFIKNK